MDELRPTGQLREEDFSIVDQQRAARLGVATVGLSVALGLSLQRPQLNADTLGGRVSAKQDESGCVKVWIDLPNHWATGGESMWARPVGPDLYELRNVPFHAYGLNFLDVVRAVPRQSDQKPEVLTVVRPSGHRTLRVIFNECVAIPDRGPLLAQLNPLGTTYENADAVQFSIDIEPDGYYERVCQQLDEWEQTGLLSYETCEPRVAGTFDDAPPEEDG